MHVLSLVCSDEATYQETWSTVLFSETPINADNLFQFLNAPAAMMRANWRQVEDTLLEFRSHHMCVGIGAVMLRDGQWLAFLMHTELGRYDTVDEAIARVEQKAREGGALAPEALNAKGSEGSTQPA